MTQRIILSFVLLVAVIGLTGRYWRREVNTVLPTVEARESSLEVGKTASKDASRILKASWYRYRLGDEWWSDNHLTAASRDLPRYSYARITNTANNKSVVVWINDYVENLKVDIDLSNKAFARIADLKLGIISVKIEQL